RTTNHGLARSTQRTRRRLPRANRIDKDITQQLNDLYTPEVTGSSSRQCLFFDCGKLDDLGCWLACCPCGYGRVMDAGLLWAVVGSVAGVLAVVLAGWQVRLQLLERREKRRRGPADERAPVSEVGGLPVAVPLGLLPGEVRGRDALLAEL